MGIQAELRLAGRPVRAMADPTGGLFDAAGDFDRLLRTPGPALRLLGTVDPHGEVWFSHDQMPDLVADIDVLLDRASPGPEHRGLVRLRSMAARCAQGRGHVVFVGD